MKVTVIGAYGKMGKWFCRFFSEKGWEVVGFGRDRRKLSDLGKDLGIEVSSDMSQAIKDSDIIMISVVADSLESVAKQIATHIRPDQKVVDISSVKTSSLDLLHIILKKNVILGAHPMFGPSAKGSGYNFILTPTSASERKFSEEFSSVLKRWGFNVSVMEPEYHDDMMSIVLGLSHFIGLVTAEVWASKGFDSMKPAGGTSFRALMELCKNVVSNDPEFYYSLQKDLPQAEIYREKFIEKSKEISDMVKRGDKRKFVEMMSSLSKKIK